MTMTTEKLAELKRLARREAAYYKDQWDLGPTLKADGWGNGLAAYLDACSPATILSLIALAERALQPEEGRAVPVGMFVQDGAGFYHQVPPSVVKNYPDDPGRVPLYASQLALPAGPVPEQEDVMRGKMSLAAEISRLESIISEVHSWIVCSAICTDEDMMNNASRIAAITHPQFDGIGIPDNDYSSPAVAQPVADVTAQGELSIPPGWKPSQGVETDINKRWEAGTDHHPKSVQAFEAIRHLDEKFCGDTFCWKAGGDGDNGETLMYGLDIFFESRAALCQPAEEGGES